MGSDHVDNAKTSQITGKSEGGTGGTMNGGDYTVTLRYDPGTPKTYRVVDAPGGREAVKSVLASLGYHPGVHVHVREYRKGDSWDYAIDYVPLSPEMEELIRYND